VRSEAEPAVVVTPATSNVSLIVIGTPWNGPHDSRRALASSAARARASAASAASITIAFSGGLWRAMRSSMREVSSTDEIWPARIAQATSSAEAKSRSATAARARRVAGSAAAPARATLPARNERRPSVIMGLLRRPFGPGPSRPRSYQN
jgi:hypothetical protein